SLGRHHARVLASLPGVRAAGVYDLRPERAAEVAGEFGIPAAPTLEALIASCDAVVVATPTVAHREAAAAALDAGRHVLVEKPMATTLEEADDTIARAKRRGLVLQVGHIERFNPAVEAAMPLAAGARFIETHRLGVFTARSLDVDVVLDLMIHDLQIAQAIVGRPVEEVRAAGVAVLTPRVDIANARIAFEGGCVANLTASRVSAEKVRKFRVFAPAHYVSIDMGTQEIGAVRLVPGPDGKPAIVPAAVSVAKEEPLRLELAGFAAACRGERPPLVSGSEGRAALALALDVRAAIEEHQRAAARGEEARAAASGATA
ncbi:MAG TPA: Gfo/Idh/MocA family oxidoreductase, partial [Thermoanaerobaculia bacterium]|nr:Gfo/Idh/MocA family oxidoreductase [Thermoanaerobaculia bacterium]